MDDEGSLLWAVGLSWVVLARGPTHSCNQMVAGPRIISRGLCPHIRPLGWAGWHFGASRASLSPCSPSTGLAWSSPELGSLTLVGLLTWKFWIPRVTLPRDRKWKLPASCGPVQSWHSVTSAGFYWSSSHRAHPHSRKAVLGSTPCYKEGQRIWMAIFTLPPCHTDWWRPCVGPCTRNWRNPKMNKTPLCFLRASSLVEQMNVHRVTTQITFGT